MSEYKKFSNWISQIEKQLKAMHGRKAATETRISKKISRLMSDVAKERLSPAAKVDVYNRLNRMARCLEAEDTNMATLEQVEKEVDRIYGDQSANGTYYFSRKGSRTTLEELEDLSTYSPEDHLRQHDDVMPEQKFDGVREVAEEGRKTAQSSWSDFSRD